VPGVDLSRYAADLQERFRNPANAHGTYQIAMDGTQKLPQRLLEPALVALEREQAIDIFAFAVAAWMRYALGRKDDGETYALRDPREKEIAAILERAGNDAGAAVGLLSALPGLFPTALTGSKTWTAAVRHSLSVMMEKGMRTAIEAAIG
jgi:fructuronate reductase